MSLPRSGALAALVVGLLHVHVAPSEAAPVATAVLYNSTGGAENGGDPVSPTTGAGPILADRFVTTFAADLTSVTLNIGLTSAPTGSFTVDLFSDAGAAGPGTATVLATVSDNSLSGSLTPTTYTATATVPLAANSSYYVGIADINSSSAAILGNTVDPTVLNRPSVVAGASYFNNGGLQANSGGPYEVVVNATPIPEPAGWTLLLAGIASLGVVRFRKGGRAA